MPDQAIVLLRHAEKPVPGSAIRGVDEHGNPDVNGLSVQGWQRAGALVRWLCPVDRPPRFGQPTFLCAAKTTSRRPSRRPVLTLLPLSRALHLPVHAEFETNAVADAALALARTDGTRVVSWRRRLLPSLARATARQLNCDAQDIPSNWPADRFDIAWVFVRHPEGWRFEQETQNLLAQDRQEKVACMSRSCAASMDSASPATTPGRRSSAA